MDVVSTVSSSFGIINTVIEVGVVIYDAVNKVKSFKAQSQRLGRRINALTRPVEILLEEVKAGRKENSLPSDEEIALMEKQRGSWTDGGDDGPLTYIRSLKDLAECMIQVEGFIKELSSLNFTQKLWKKNTFGDKFDSFNNQLTTLQQSLSFSLQVKLGKSFTEEMKKQINEAFNHNIMMKEDLEDLKKDLEDLKEDMSNLMNTVSETNMLVKLLSAKIDGLEKKLRLNTSGTESDLRIKFDELSNLEELVNGTFGPIYKAQHQLVHKLVIKKYTDTATAAKKELKEQLNLWKKLKYSQFIVQVLGYTIDYEGHMYFVVEYMQYGTLRSVLQNKEAHPLPWDIRLRMANDCAQGLYAIHHCQLKTMLHRAVTSTRFLVNEDYRAKISDNGFVKSVSSSVKKSNLTEQRGDVEQDEMNYICPEETENLRRTIKSEVYKFGVVLYEIASRKKPFQSMETDGITLSKEQKFDFISNGQTEDPPEDTPRELKELITRCRKKDPTDRPPTQEVVRSLNAMCKLG